MFNDKKIRIAFVVLSVVLSLLVVLTLIINRLSQKIPGNQTNTTSPAQPTIKNNSEKNQKTANINNNENSPIVSKDGSTNNLNNKQLNKQLNNLNDNVQTDKTGGNNSQTGVNNYSTAYVPNYRPVTIAPTIGEQQRSIDLLSQLFGLFFNTNYSFNSTAADINNPSLGASQNPPVSPTPQMTASLHKTGVYLMSNYSSGARQIIMAKPQIIKVMDPSYHPGLLQAVKDYKNINSNGLVVIRFYEGTQNIKMSTSDDPELSAEMYFNQIIDPRLNALGNNLQLFNYLETPNELDNTPGWESGGNAVWLGRFWAKLVSLNAQKGIKTCIASIPVANPPGDYQAIKARMQDFLPALQATLQTGGALCYHAYTLNYTTDAAQEAAASLRYRLIHQAISEIDPASANLPIILSEAGVDQSGDPKNSGWQARGGPQQYINWLIWFDQQISQDNYVLGATLYQIGDTSWSSFDLEPIAGWITQNLITP